MPDAALASLPGRLGGGLLANDDTGHVQPAWFAAVRDHVWPAVADVALRIDHVGSTSVPGLAAKPIIDMDIVVASSDQVRPVIERLATIGYSQTGSDAPPAERPDLSSGSAAGSTGPVSADLGWCCSGDDHAVVRCRQRIYQDFWPSNALRAALHRVLG